MVKPLPLAGSLKIRSDRMTKRNEVMSILRIEDYSGAANVVAFPKVFSQSQQFLAVDMIVKVKGRVDADEKVCKLLQTALRH